MLRKANVYTEEQIRRHLIRHHATKTREVLAGELGLTIAALNNRLAGLLLTNTMPRWSTGHSKIVRENLHLTQAELQLLLPDFTGRTVGRRMREERELKELAKIHG